MEPRRRSTVRKRNTLSDNPKSHDRGVHRPPGLQGKIAPKIAKRENSQTRQKIAKIKAASWEVRMGKSVKETYRLLGVISVVRVHKFSSQYSRIQLLPRDCSPGMHLEISQHTASLPDRQTLIFETLQNKRGKNPQSGNLSSGKARRGP